MKDLYELIKPYYHKRELHKLYSFNVFIKLPIWLKLGIIMNWLKEEHSIQITATDHYYIAFSIDNDKCKLPTTDNDTIIEEMNISDIFDNYIILLDKLIPLIKEPF